VCTYFTLAIFWECLHHRKYNIAIISLWELLLLDVVIMNVHIIDVETEGTERAVPARIMDGFLHLYESECGP